MNRTMPTLYSWISAPLTLRGFATLLLIACFVLLAGCSTAERELDRAVDEASRQVDDAASGGSGTSSGQASVHMVSRVVDGDTIEVTPDAAAGNPDVRFLAVDTPETYGGTEPLGPEAKDFTARQLEGEKVRLEYDEDRVDPYDRALAHVSIVGEDQTIQEQLVSRGLAQTAFFEPNDLYTDQLLSIQEDARQRQVGIWGLPVSEQCNLANRGNGVGEGTAQCQG